MGIIETVMSLRENPGCSITQRIKQIKQPGDGYIDPETLEVEPLDKSSEALSPKENVSSVLIDLAVDCMTRFRLGEPVNFAFVIPLSLAWRIGVDGFKMRHLIDGINGLDDGSIINALKLSGFVDRFLADPENYQPFEEVDPDEATIQNVRTMVERSCHFFDVYGPKFLDGFALPGGYTDTVSFGDIGFITSDTLWDFEVSKSRPTKEQTLRLLMHWRMGLRSAHASLFHRIKYLGIYNPRLDKVYRIEVVDIPKDVIAEVEKDVIGYPE